MVNAAVKTENAVLTKNICEDMYLFCQIFNRKIETFHFLLTLQFHLIIIMKYFHFME